MPLFTRHTEEHETLPIEPPVEEKRHGLFGSKKSTSPVRTEHPVPVEEKRHGLFGSHRSASPVRTEHPVPVEEKRHGLFGSRRRSTSPAPSAATQSTQMTDSTYHTSPTRHSSNRRSLLHRFGNGNDSMDPSIIEARERVMGAETAEREADRALDIARREVREAREHVRRLELEAKEEARLAKIKQFHAKEVSKRGKALGRTLTPFGTASSCWLLTRYV